MKLVRFVAPVVLCLVFQEGFGSHHHEPSESSHKKKYVRSSPVGNKRHCRWVCGHLGPGPVILPPTKKPGSDTSSNCEEHSSTTTSSEPTSKLPPGLSSSPYSSSSLSSSSSPSSSSPSSLPSSSSPSRCSSEAGTSPPPPPTPPNNPPGSCGSVPQGGNGNKGEGNENVVKNPTLSPASNGTVESESRGNGNINVDAEPDSEGNSSGQGGTGVGNGGNVELNIGNGGPALGGEGGSFDGSINGNGGAGVGIGARTFHNQKHISKQGKSHAPQNLRHIKGRNQHSKRNHAGLA